MVDATLFPDIARFARSADAARLASFLTIGLAMPSILFIALIPSIATGEQDLVKIMAGLGLGLPAIILVTFKAWTTNAGNLYSAALAIERIVPRLAYSSIVVAGQRRAWLVRPRANAVWVDAATARIVMASDGRDLGIHQRISEMADPLHFGTVAGYWTRIPWFLFGPLMAGLTVSGAAIYSHRIAHSARDDHPKPDMERNVARGGPLALAVGAADRNGGDDDRVDAL
ncbi:MAG: PepSY domain-containing protein [Sphingopyxis sp.]|nr:PepSY domain-containing protein [Sphingopyxis sp.]